MTHSNDKNGGQFSIIFGNVNGLKEKLQSLATLTHTDDLLLLNETNFTESDISFFLYQILRYFAAPSGYFLTPSDYFAIPSDYFGKFRNYFELLRDPFWLLPITFSYFVVTSRLLRKNRKFSEEIRR